MAEKTEFLQAIDDAILDADSLERFINGSDSETVLTRLSAEYPTLKKALKELFENGGLPATPFKTKALMEASALVDGKYAMVTDDTVNNGLYVKTAGAWVKSGYDPLTQAKSYTDTAKTEAISIAEGDATTKADTAKSEAISASATDATTKADTAKSEAINDAKTYTDDEVASLKSHLIDYTDSSVGAIDFSAHKLTGEQIYNKALEDTNQPFSAIWAEYNKPVWHIGDLVFVDAVGAEVDVVERELVFTLKATQVNQTFYFPASLQDGESFTVDWGDGSVSDVTRLRTRHDYICEIGDEFVVRAKGQVNDFTFKDPAVVANSNVMLISIDKNTLPKVTRTIGLRDCVNLQSVCAGAFSSYIGTSLNLRLLRHCPSLVLNKDMFLGLSQVVNIDNLISNYGKTFDNSIPQGLLDPFTDVESAEAIFHGATSKIPSDILRNMPKLKNARRMFLSSKSPESDLTEVFKYQKNLDNVSECFKFTTVQGDALRIYQDIARGSPSETGGCFNNASGMTNTGQVPEGWK